LALQALRTFGYHSTPVDHPEGVVAKFCEDNGLKYEKYFFNYTITPAEVVPETAKDVEDKWEKIRQEQHQRRQKLAEARKKRETQTK